MRYEIENAQIFGLNFSGTRFNGKGGENRSFCLCIDDPNMLESLANEGVPIKTRQFKQDEEPCYYVVVKVKFNNEKKPPVIQLRSGKSITRMTEELLTPEFDGMRFYKCDVIVNSGRWTSPNGNTGMGVYLQNIYCYLQRNRFEEAFFDFGDEEEETPFA